MNSTRLRLVFAGLLAASAGSLEAQSLADQPSDALAADGRFISWREHLVDDEGISGVELRGGDGLAIADLDRDGYRDIVSVHESDDQYDGVPEGHIRIAFGTADPDVWELRTLAEGPEAGAAEDVAIGDLNGDGWLDIVAACELAHLIYFQNPGAQRAGDGDGAADAPVPDAGAAGDAQAGRAIRDARWPRLIPTAASNRGSFIRVFLADLNGDGRLEVVAANKGAQDPTQARQEPKPISFFEIAGAPLEDEAWIEHVLTEVPWPINAETIDLDNDGDIDVVGGSVALRRMMWFENVGRSGGFDFLERTIVPSPPSADDGSDASDGDAESALAVHGFNMAYVDLSGDGRFDIVTFDTPPLIGRRLLWLEQPAAPAEPWTYHLIDSYAPDSVVGIAVADIDDDGDPDIMTGGYSLGSRTSDQPTPDGALGRLAWYENRGDDGWARHDFSRRQRGMFDKFIPLDMDGDGDVDFAATRGNSGPFDGVLWLEQVRSEQPRPAFEHARAEDSPEVPLPAGIDAASGAAIDQGANGE